MTRDLFVSSFAPTLGTGRALRTFTCIRALSLLGPVDLAYVPLGGDGPSPEYRAIDGLEFHEIVPSRGARRAAVYAGARARAVPDDWARGVSPELIAGAKALTATPGRGRVVAGDLSAAVAMIGLARRRPVTFNAHNVASAYRATGHGERPWSRAAIHLWERRVFRAAAESWVVSHADLDAARVLAPQARLRYVPNAVDVSAIRAPGPPPGDQRLLMVGDFHYGPNRSARAHLVDEVMPRVWRELPEARLTIAGRGSADWTATDDRIEVAGFVEDLGTVYARVDCVAVPITEGGGSPLKFIEALAHRRPVVATAFAARGLEVVAGEHYAEGADPAAFAASVVWILREGAPEMAARARKLAEERYSVESLAERIAA